MVQPPPKALAALYEADETAWLEQTAEFVRAGRFDQLDPGTLAEYLTDMAKRDRREVVSRLVVVLKHLLKWDHQPERRSGSWRASIREQRRQLREVLDSGTLRNHALALLIDAYHEARGQAADEAELNAEVFPAELPWTLEEIVAEKEL